MPTKGDNTKAMILEKATELFIKKGYSAVTMKDICEATGLSRGGLYRHFNSTGEMMACLLVEEQQFANERMRQDIAAGKTSGQLLDAYIEVHNRFLLSPKSLLEGAANQYSLLDKNGRKINEERMWAAVKRLTHIIRMGQEDGIFIDGDPEDLAWHINFFIAGIRTQTVLGQPTSEFIQTQTNYIRQFLLKGDR